MNLLIIDDSEDDRLLYRRSLLKDSPTTYVIVEAADGEEGLQKIPEAMPECILLDYSLPGRNGIEVLKRIRAKHPFIPVVMLTGQGNESIAVTAIHEGAQNYITKSTITPESIQRVVQAAVEHCAMSHRIHDQRTALEIFTRALAHDLKEPVRTIKSFLDLMASRETLTEKGQSYLRYIQNAADRMGTLIDTVYFYTRLDSAPQDIGKELCDVGTVLEEAKENIGQLITERKAAITHDQLPQAYINRMQLMQVLQNLLCNAIRHCDGEPAIHIQAVHSEGRWLMRVADNGPGIEETYRQQIFEPFKRISRHKEQGLGLGLAICKKIVESYGGKIWYEPGSNKGAVFTFTLPEEAPEIANAGITALPRPAFAQGEKPVASILLVEDSEADIELAKIMLLEEAHLQCNFLVAHDAFEALTMMRAEAAQGNRVDLVLLDINMPGMDGFDLLKKMTEDEGLNGIPVVMCTTSTYDKDMEKARALGVIGYLTKPAELAKLKAVLEKLSGVHLQPEGDGYVLLRAA